jgi:hypothetical protein
MHILHEILETDRSMFRHIWWEQRSSTVHGQPAGYETIDHRSRWMEWKYLPCCMHAPGYTRWTVGTLEAPGYSCSGGACRPYHVLVEEIYTSAEYYHQNYHVEIIKCLIIKNLLLCRLFTDVSVEPWPVYGGHVHIWKLWWGIFFSNIGGNIIYGDLHLLKCLHFLKLIYILHFSTCLIWYSWMVVCIFVMQRPDRIFKPFK